MSSQDEQRSPQPPPPREHPLAKLGQEIERNKYEPSPQELPVLQTCYEEMERYKFNGAAAMGIFTLSLTMAMEWKLKVIPRLILTGAAAVLGAELGFRYSLTPCMEKLLSLGEDSPMRGELISILRADFPDDPLLKKSQYEYSLPTIAREPDVYGAEGRDAVVPEGSALETGDLSAKPSDWAAMLGRGGRDSSGRISERARPWNGSRQDNVGKDSSGAELLADPFDLIMQTGPFEEPGDRKVSEGRQERQQHEEWHEKRRSRMSTRERRDHDRQAYAQRREQRPY